jgi:hypothetical protein
MPAYLVRSIKISIPLLTILVLSSFQSTFATESENFCKDRESWKEWNSLVEKYPGDQDIQIFNALRIGLCAKIDQGSITFEEANDLFNRAHKIIIKKKSAERNLERKDLQMKRKKTS